MATIPFRARARTVDHLGREQIADCPTAVSELWKNAYDAYARCAELHVFAGTLPVAAVVDDGHGMSETEFIERWLMLGTESKIGADQVAEADRGDLPLRPRQGQKGIGRLSVAYLGPTVLVLSKRHASPFVAALVDWRLFQNPYLTLDDVRLPVETFAEANALAKVVGQLCDGLVDNVWGSDVDPARRLRLEGAWGRFSHEEAQHDRPATADAVADVAMQVELNDALLSTWPVWRGDAEHGTAMFVFGAVRELSCLLEGHFAGGDDEVKEVVDKLKDTLTGFTNPYLPVALDFRYRVLAHGASAAPVQILGSDETFDLSDLRDLEHGVEGCFDAHGVFKGRVRAWGKDLGHVTVSPARPPPLSGAAAVGPFEIALGSFEAEFKHSTHAPDAHERIDERARRFSGLAVYRDGLRVQPYGRPENDFFGIEERRQKNVGREFWAKRRMFGGVSLTREGNPHLRDKAGREGFIDNQAAREFRRLVVELLKTLARRYFGTDSELRKPEISEAIARYDRAKRAEEAAKKRRTSTLRRSIREQADALDTARREAAALIRDLEAANSAEVVDRTANRLTTLQALRASLALPPRPRRLQPTDEERYRRYRDDYADLTAQLERASKLWSERAGAQAGRAPEEVARSALARHQKSITDATGRWRTAIQQRLDDERRRWIERVRGDNQRYYPLGVPLLEDLAHGRMTLPAVLAELEGLRERLHDELAPDYDGYLRALDALRDGVDLDAAVGSALDERVALSEKVEQWQALAQLGITVEIVGHELNESASQVSRNLARLPQASRETEAFKLAAAGFTALVRRLEFLAPLRLSGPQMRTSISGAAIEQYVRSFFDRALAGRHVELEATDAFRATELTEYTHRIYPAFVNLVNNALYWVTQGQCERRILLDRRGGDVLIADTGPGIDPDDEAELFGLFFTRRVGGRGVGLYLSRLALAQGRHGLRLAAPAERILPGATFVITFRELNDVDLRT